MVQKVNKDAWLTDAQGKSLELRMDRLTRLGRAIENDIVLEDSTVSQRHAVISFDDGDAFLRDLGSSNGTFIEGYRVPGGRLTNGTAIKLGRVALIYGENVAAYSAAPPVSRASDRARTSAVSGSTARAQTNFFSAKTGVILGALFLLSLVATLAGRALVSSSSSSVGYPGVGTLVEGQNYRLPDASSDFIGDWCGWAHVSSCDPPGSCHDEAVPWSMVFKSDAGGVLMHYTIEAPPETEIRDIDVRAVDSRNVRVTHVERRTDSTGAEVLINVRTNLLSVSSAVVQLTEYATFSANGVSAGSEENSAELGKCTDQWRASEEKFQAQHNFVDEGEVTGRVPSK
jgi:hypothetical protein